MIFPKTNVQNIRNTFIDLYKNKKFVKDKSGVDTIEIINASFIADQEAIFGTPNTDWHQRELTWYLSQSLNVNDIPAPIPKIWQAVADKEGFINSNYGWMIFSEENFNQYAHCLKALQNDSTSRRAEMIYTRPSMQLDYNKNGRSDFVCCQYTQHLIRDNKLISLIYFRSSDSVHGYKGDRFFADWVHTSLYENLLTTYPDLQLGDIIWNASSLHIYEAHFPLIEKYIEENK